jgi:hypothetical protein
MFLPQLALPALKTCSGGRPQDLHCTKLSEFAERNAPAGRLNNWLLCLSAQGVQFVFDLGEADGCWIRLQHLHDGILCCMYGSWPAVGTVRVCWYLLMSLTTRKHCWFDRCENCSIQ